MPQQPTNITLADALRKHLMEQLSQRGYGSAREYVGDLTREDGYRKQQAY